MSVLVYPVMSKPMSKYASTGCYMFKRRQRVVSMYLYQPLKTSATIAGQQHSPRYIILNVFSSPVNTFLNLTRCASVLRKLIIPLNKSPTENNDNIPSVACSVKVVQNGVPGRISDCLNNSTVQTYPRKSRNLSEFLVGDSTPVPCRMMSTYCLPQMSWCAGNKTWEPTVLGRTRSFATDKNQPLPEPPSTSSGSKMLKVAVVGAAGGLGQPLSLMLKQSPLIDELALYDINSTRGMGLDISHVDTKCKVHAYTGVCELQAALRGACIVLVVVGSSRKPDQNAEMQFTTNAEIMRCLGEACANVCPNAILAIMTEPVTSMVPILVEVLRKCGQYSPTRVLGVTALDGVRANTFTAEVLGKPPENVLVPVIGGCSGPSAVPLFSQARPRVEFSCAEVQRLTQLVQEAGMEVGRAKGSRTTPSLALAFAAARFAISLCKGACGQQCVVECAYVRSDTLCNCDYLTTPVELGPAGVQRNLGLPKLTEVEKCLLQRSVKILQEDIRKGVCYVIGDDPPAKECPDEPDTPPKPPKRQCLNVPKSPCDK